MSRREEHGPSSVIWLTGLSGAGKSTLANALRQAIQQRGGSVVLLDGDDLRRGVNSDLGYSDAERAENIRRAAELAGLCAAQGVQVIAAFICPRQELRDMAREIVAKRSPGTRFHEVFVTAPLEVCEQRDVKGLYRQARKGEVSDFTGISSSFEVPRMPDIVIDTDRLSLDAALAQLIAGLEP